MALGSALWAHSEAADSSEMGRSNRSWRVDETRVKVACDSRHALDSAGETIEFMLSPKRDLIAAKLFLRLIYPAASRGHG